jgi:NADH-quinone oxidoreductase subunit M
MHGSWYLIVLTLLPLAGALVVALVPRTSPGTAKTLAMVFSVATLAIGIAAWAAFKDNGPRFQFRWTAPWIPTFGTSFILQADGIALVMLLLICVLVPLVMLASWNDAESSRRSVSAYFALILALEFCMIGVFAAGDVFLFYVFFEIMLVPMYFLIGSYGPAGTDADRRRRQYAAVKFFLYSLVGGLLMLAAVIGLWVVSSNQVGANGKGTFDWQKLTTLSMSTSTERWLFLGFFIAFAIKAPFFPFHTWLPDAGGAAPAGAGALLVGVLDKVGTFGILRYCLPLFPHASRYFAPLGLVLALVGIIYGALLAVGQNDLKRLVSYTSIAHFGFIGIGIFAFTTQAGTGAVLYMVNHGLATGLLFLVVGMFVARRGSSSVTDFGGAGKLLPVLAGVFFFAGLASLALPGTSPFISEFLVLIGTFTVNKTVAVIGTIGIILACAYVLWMVQRTTQGTVNPVLEKVERMRTDITPREVAVVAPLVILILFLGFYPKPVIDVINPAIKATLSNVGVTDPGPTTSASGGGK